MSNLDNFLPNYRITLMVDGVDVTEGAKEMWDEIGGDEHPDLDWKSFLNGWLEGRLDLLKDSGKI